MSTEIALSQKITQVRDLMQRSKNEIHAALPKHLTPERLMRISLTEIRKNPKLLDCDMKSLMGSIIQAAQLGLEPGSALGHCYLIPFFNQKRGISEAQFMMGYRGMLDLIQRSDRVSHVVARAVFSGDDFDFRYGSEEKITHIPDLEGECHPNDLTHVYCVASFRDGSRAFEVMNRNQIEAIRSRSKQPQGIWATDFEAMARKTVIRRLFKYLPVSIQIQQAITMDEAAEADLSQDPLSVFEPEEIPEQKQVHKIKSAKSTNALEEKPKAAVVVEPLKQETFDPRFDQQSLK